MTPEILFAGLITVIGACAFVGTMIWTLNREDEALQEALHDKPRLAPRPSTPNKTTENSVPNDH